MDDLLKGLETKISEQDNKIAQLEKEQRESTNGQLNARISQIETDIAALQTSSTSAEADQNAIEQKIATLQTELASLKTAQGTAASKADLQALIERAESLESNVAAMQKEIDTLKSGSTGGSTGTKSAEQLRQELLVAIRYSSPNIANALLDAGADPNSKYSADYAEGRTALVLAVANNLATVVQKLIDKGADATAQSKNSYYIPLFQVRSEAVYDILVAAGADVNAKDQYGENFLFDSRRIKANEFAAILPKAVAEGLDINASGRYGEKMLSQRFYGALNSELDYDNYLERIKAILAIPSLDINATDTRDETALDLLDSAYCSSSSSTEEAACNAKKAEIRKPLTDAGAQLAADLP